MVTREKQIDTARDLVFTLIFIGRSIMQDERLDYSLKVAADAADHLETSGYLEPLVKAMEE